MLSNQSDPSGHEEGHRGDRGMRLWGWWCPAAGLEQPVNVNVLLEPTYKGPELSVALPTAELRPTNGLVLPKVSILGFCTLTSSLQCPMPLWGISYKLALPRPDRCVAAAPASTGYIDWLFLQLGHVQPHIRTWKMPFLKGLAP